MQTSKKTEELNFNKIWLLFQETDRQMKETDKKLNKLQATVSGIGSNNGAMAEEFFFNGLKNRKELFGIEYEHIDKFERYTKKLSGEYDIVLFNGDYMIVIEVKYRLHPSDVTDFYGRKLVDFRVLFPEYAQKKVLGCVAALSISKESRDLALQNGLLVLTQNGDSIKLMNNKNFKPVLF
jgi:hypothetical protein